MIGSPRPAEFCTTEPTAADQYIRRHYAPYRVTWLDGRHDFRFKARVRALGRLSTEYLEHSASLRTENEPFDDYFVVRSFDGPVRVGGRDRDVVLEQGGAAIIAPRVPHALEWRGLKLGMVRIPEPLIAQAAGGAYEAGELADRLDLAQPSDQERLRQWSATLHFVVNAVYGNEAVAQSPQVRAETDRLLATMTVACFGSNLMDPGDGGVGQRSLRRAIGFIETHAAETISTSDLAAAAHVTPRALQQAFRRHFDTTPMLYLRTVRLRAARSDLLGAESESVTVAEVAARWGFPHPGRFSVCYRTEFGESPSQTLRQDTP